jgi:phage protein D
LPTVNDRAEVSVTVNGTRLPKDAYNALVEVLVELDVLAPSLFTLKLATWDEDTLQFSWVDSALFAVGGEVSVSFGYGERLSTVLTGEITGLELDLASGETPWLVVRGYDRRHRLARGTTTRSFIKMTDSDIAAQIASARGLNAQTVPTTVTYEYILQHAESDLDFLNRRAVAIGYEVVVDAKTLYFRPHQTSAAPAVALAMDADLLEFHARITAYGQAGEVDVRGWDPVAKQAIVATATATQLRAMGSNLGPATADAAFGQAAYTEAQLAVATPQEGAQIALGHLQNLALGFMHGEGTCLGHTDLKAGTVVQIAGAGRRFSGSYYVTSAAHSFARLKGYRTRFNARRNAT